MISDCRSAAQLASGDASAAPAADAAHWWCMSFVMDTHLARSVLTALGLAAEPATFTPARDPPRAEFAWDDPA